MPDVLFSARLFRRVLPSIDFSQQRQQEQDRRAPFHALSPEML
jgi:hypothetical protein